MLKQLIKNYIYKTLGRSIMDIHQRISIIGFCRKNILINEFYFLFFLVDALKFFLLENFFGFFILFVKFFWLFDFFERQHRSKEEQKIINNKSKNEFLTINSRGIKIDGMIINNSLENEFLNRNS